MFKKWFGKKEESKPEKPAMDTGRPAPMPEAEQPAEGTEEQGENK